MNAHGRIAVIFLFLGCILAPLAASANGGDPVARSVEYIAALGETPGEKAYNHILNFFENDNPVIRAASVQALGRRGESRSVPIIVRALDDKSETVRMYAVISLRALNAKSQANALAPLIADPDPFVRAEALRSHLQLVGADSFHELVESLKDPDYRVRATSAECLGELAKVVGTGKVVPHLVLTLADSNKVVRMYTARALGEAGDENASGPLRALLNDPEPMVRDVAAEALKRLGIHVPKPSEEITLKKLAVVPAEPAPASPAAAPAISAGMTDLTRDDITGDHSLSSMDISVNGLRIGDDMRKASQVLGSPTRQNVKKQTLHYPGLRIGYGSDQRIHEISISADYAGNLAPANRELVGVRIATDDGYRKKLLGEESEISIEEVNVFGAEFQHYVYSYEQRGLQLKITEAKGNRTVAFLTLVPPTR